jgi:hypothetical protein
MAKVKHLEVVFWKHGITANEMADIVEKISTEIRKGKNGRVVSGVPYIESITWKLW